MCLFPKLIKNPKYRVNKKNKGIVPEMKDLRVGMVPIGCGWCMECLKQKANEWRVRLAEEIRSSEGDWSFVTFTFSDESVKHLTEIIWKQEKIEGYALDNEIATVAVRRFLERWRRKYKKSLRHWFITELGHEGTENVHLHGIVKTRDLDEVERVWNNGRVPYGFIWKGKKKRERLVNYVNEKTISYMVKYATKADGQHRGYKPKILCSKGIGAGYMKRLDAKLNEFKKNGETKDFYRTRTGYKVGLPIYYRNKIYSDEEKEELWLRKLDENKRYVGGEEIDADDDETYYKLLEFYRKKNRKLGFGSPLDWDSRQYEFMRRKLLHKRRMDRAGDKGNK